MGKEKKQETSATETVEEIKKNAKEAESLEEINEEVKEEKPTEEETPVEEDEVTSLQNEVQKLNDEIAKLKNAYAMAYADTENTRKRLTKEHEQYMRYHIQSFALEILPVLDNCERALAVKAEDSNDENYRKAFEMVLKQLTSALQKEGVEEIDCLDKEYDPNWMQAMMSVQVEGVEPNQVVEVLQKGYKLKDRLLRAAMVKVSE